MKWQSKNRLSDSLDAFDQTDTASTQGAEQELRQGDRGGELVGGGY